MGSRISVDKHVSCLQEILDINLKVLEQVKFDSNVPDCITQHIKIWKFSEDIQGLLKVRSDPINLSLIQNSGFNFLSNECYLVLLVYKKSHQDHNKFLSFPHQMWGTVESYSNLTPRGLESPLAASDKEIFESFLLPQRSEPNVSSEFEYMIFVWNGKAANPLVKASALSNAFELENLLNKGRENLLEILFSGGVIRNKKLQRGSVMQFNSQAETPMNFEIEEHVKDVRETVYLLNFLFPDPPQKPREYAKLRDFLQNRKHNKDNESDYSRRFTKVNPINKIKIEENNQVSKKELVKDSNEGNDRLETVVNGNVQELSVPEVVQPVISRRMVPSLNFKQLPSQDIQVPKFNLNLKNVVSPPLSSQRQECQQLDIGVSLDPDVEYSEIPNETKNAMRLSLGKLRFDQREEATYQDIEEEDRSGFNFDIRDTDRKKIKIQYFAEICSEVVKDFLYVGGEQIAHNREILLKLGVTHVINCAGDVCVNKFPEDFNYLTYYLKDSKTENIECIFYEIIQYIDDIVGASGGKVLVHCVQGVSRSVSVCIAYLIYKQKLSYSEAFDIIKKARGVASPNMGFTVQLLLFQKRLQGSYDSIPVSPRVFAIGRGVNNQNDLVCRMLMDQLYAGKTLRTFDSRGVFLVQSENEFFIWVGPECLGQRQQNSITHAYNYSNILKIHENAPQIEPVILTANEEPLQFWQLWGFQNNTKPAIISQKVKEWDTWYNMLPIENQIEEQEIIIKRDIDPQRRSLLFLHPDSTKSVGVFDLEDLESQNLCLLMKETPDWVLQVFIWRGLVWDGNDDDERDFVDTVIQENYRHISHENIFIYKEEPNSESEEFLDCFQ